MAWMTGDWWMRISPAILPARGGRRRLTAERAWQALPLPAHVFRLSGIYGPGRSIFDTIRAGRAQRVVKPGHAFNRIHVKDIAGTVLASIQRPNPGRVYNLADDLPAPSADLVTYACELLGIQPPPEIPFEQAILSPMARDFWADNKRIDNRRIKQELGVNLLYPTYREGLDAIFAGETGAGIKSPLAGIRHRCPGFGRGQRGARLQQFDRDIVRRADERHAAVARGAVDGDALVQQALWQAA